MKFTVNVECSPEEARRFRGLPDVTPINDTWKGSMLGASNDVKEPSVSRKKP